MAASYSLLCFYHRFLLLRLLVLNLHIHCVLSDDCPARDNCMTGLPILLPFNYLDAPPNCGINVITCNGDLTWISLFNQKLAVSDISYSERRIDILYNPMLFKDSLCRSPEKFDPQADQLFLSGFRFQTPHATSVFNCSNGSGDLGGAQMLRCPNGSALYMSPSPHFVPPPDFACIEYKIAAPVISSEGSYRPETFSLEWDFDCGSGGKNLPACHCKDGSPRPSGCKGTSRKGKKIIIGGVAAAVASFLSKCLLFFFTRSRWLSSSRRSPAGSGCFQLHTPTNVEKSSIDYEALTATRYTYNDILKMTENLKCKLGQGGYGSVYEGHLPSGTPVAVKLMEKSYNDGEEFWNEVATMGRIHHVNVVRLLGFCAEGSRRGLVYEFMENGSLEKITNTIVAGRCMFRPERLHHIALGIARGIEYLHQGCDRRIIHFDIKPHNILLDHDYAPKISDFGLAKLYCKDRSSVTIRESKGTIGYIAPELFYGNSRRVSHKSDVYSFGMLLIAMVGMKEKICPAEGSSSEAYFPHWIHDTLSKNQKFEGIGEGQDETIRKVATMALWCIQWNPNDRPCMKEVVKMFESGTSNLSMPPNHFYAPIQPECTIQALDSSSTSECSFFLPNTTLEL